MVRRRWLSRRVFRWMERRAASAYALVSEAIWLVHGSTLDVDPGELLSHAIPAAIHLRALVVAIDDDLDENDEVGTCEAITRIAAKARPRLEWRPDVQSYLFDLFAAAQRDVDTFHELMVRIREPGKIVAVLETVAGHLERSAELCRSRPGGMAKAGS